MRQLLKRPFSVLYLSLFSVFSAKNGLAADVSKEKIERVIRVSAAYFDLLPPSEPVAEKNAISLGSMVSFLPEIREPDLVQDMPRLHGIPLLRSSFRPVRFDEFDLVQTTTVGFLVPGLERLFGVTAKPRQWLLGAGLGLTLRNEWSTGLMFGGLQAVRTHISEVDFPLPSEILTSSSLYYAGANLQLSEFPAWLGFTVAKKNTDIVVRANDTVLLADTDSLADSKIPWLLEGSVGYRHESSPFSFGISELWVPDRLLMLRLVGCYSWDISNPN